MCLFPHGSPNTVGKHCETCGAALQSHDDVQIHMPTKNILFRFGSFHKQQRAPFVLFADFEAISRPVNATCGKQDQGSCMSMRHVGLALRLLSPMVLH